MGVAMARSGIYKSEVLRARDKLVAMGRYPSIDALRQELGNTGSKATIHRYLKEIEEEEGGKTGTKVAISEALQDLVVRLAERLQVEADARISELAAKHAAELAQSHQERESVRAEVLELRNALDKAQAELASERAQHSRTTERLQEEGVAHARARQQVIDLQDRLQSEEQHRQSLEEKHTHAREALEHFRAAAKDQREQEQRQHEQQVQYLQNEVKTLRDLLAQKQHETTLINLESARLATELSRSERSLHDVRGELRGLKEVKAELTAAQKQVERLGRQVVELDAKAGALEKQNTELDAGRAEDQAKVRQLQIDLAAAKAAAQAQDQLAEKIQAWIQAPSLNAQTARVK